MGTNKPSASGGWTWIFAQLLWWFICTKGLLAVEQFDPNVAKCVIGHFVFYNTAVTVLSDGWLLLVAYWCSRTISVHDFIDCVGLSTKPSFSGIHFICISIGLAFISVFAETKGLTGGNWVARIFAKEGAGAWSFYTTYACLVTPFAEEVAERGFLYRAFRVNYGVVFSVTLIVSWTIFGHWPIALHSWFGFVTYSVFAILLCIVREKTGSTWNCVLCHAIYNAVVLWQWPICVGIILIYLAFLFTNPNIKNAKEKGN